MDQIVVNYALYENAKEHLGTVEVDLPDLSWISTELSGAGIAGKVETIIKGHIESLSLGIKFRTMTEEAINLASPVRHTIDLRAARQDENPVSGEFEVVPIKHVMVVLPKSLSGGKVAPASPSDASGQYAVRYWAQYIDGKKVLEIDPMNYICVINGVDYLATTRAALGK